MTTSHHPTKDDFKAQGTGYLFDHLGMSFSFADSGQVTARLELERHHFAWKGRKVKRHKRWWHLTNYTNILQTEEEMGKFFTVEITNDTIKEDVVHVLKDRGLRRLEIKNDRIEVTVSRLSEDQKDIILSGIRRIAKQTKAAIDHITTDIDTRLEKAIDNQVVIPRKAYYIRRQLDATHKEYAGYIKFKELEACFKISRWTFKIPTEEDQACYDDWLLRQKVAEQAAQDKSANKM